MKPNSQKVKSPSREELATLITEIGGEARVFSILQDFYEKMSQDVMIGFFFDSRDLAHISKMQGQFLLSAAGLMQFAGKGPSTAHVALPPILSGHFDRRILMLRETLRRHSLSEPQVDAWVRFEESFRAIVVSD